MTLLANMNAATTEVAIQLGLNETGAVRRGKSIIATAQSTSATTYAVGNLTSSDLVSSVLMPTDGLLVVLYQAGLQNTVANNAKAAIFLNSSQLKIGTPGGVPVVQEATGPTAVNDVDQLTTHQGGLITSAAGAGNSSEVTTGQVVGSAGSPSVGGACYIFAAAGTYNVSVQYKNVAAGTLTASDRHLWVFSMGF